MHKVADMMAVLHDKVPLTTGIDDLLYPTFALGVDGAITCMTAVFPRRRWRSTTWFRRVTTPPRWRCTDACCPCGAPSRPGMTANAKFALELMGRKNGVARGPISGPDEALQRRIQTEMARAELI